MSTLSPPRRKTPWHVWVVGALALLWNGAGAYTIMMAQVGAPLLGCSRSPWPPYSSPTHTSSPQGRRACSSIKVR